KNKGKQKSHEFEFRHDRANRCSNVTALCLQATLVPLFRFPHSIIPRSPSSRAQARDLSQAVLITRATLRHPSAYVRSLGPSRTGVVSATRDDGRCAESDSITSQKRRRCHPTDNASPARTCRGRRVACSFFAAVTAAATG